MSIELVTRYEKAVDEQFKAESKTSLCTNQDYSWDGANSIKVYKITTAKMNDYARDKTPSSDQISLYGEIESLNATTQLMTLEKDRSFTYLLDFLDVDETGESLEASSSLARQNREVIIPELDTYVYNKMVTNAGTTQEVTLTAENIYDEILKAGAVLDDNEVPETERVLVVTPESYKLLKESGFILPSELGQDLLLKGVVNILDGALVVKVPKSRLPENVGFILTHPIATVAPVKLQEFTIHENPQFVSGFLVEGRIAYDCYVLDNKKKAIYVAKNASE